jgi:hypothetical protein
MLTPAVKARLTTTRPLSCAPRRVPNQRVAQHHPSGLKEATFGWRRLRPAVSFAAIYQDIIDALKLPRIASDHKKHLR